MLTIFSTRVPEQFAGQPIRSLTLVLRGIRKPLQELHLLCIYSSLIGEEIENDLVISFISQLLPTL